MSPSHVIEPTYRRLRQQLLVGAWPPGFRLEAVRLAEDLGVSMTPVRDSLNRLVGEHIVELRPGTGYFVPQPSERRLRDTLEFNAALLVFAIHVSHPAGLAGAADTSGDHATRVAQLFSRIAQGGGNAILSETVNSLNDRLHVVRSLDPCIRTDSEVDIDELEAICQTADKESLRHHLVRYHDLRQRLVPQYLAMIERPQD